MKKLMLLIVTIMGVALVGCESNNDGSNDNFTKCYHNPPCQDLEEHDHLVRQEYEREERLKQEKENNIYIIREDRDSSNSNTRYYYENTYNEYNNYDSYDNSNKNTTYIPYEKVYYRVITGSYSNKDNANNHINELKSHNIDCFIDETYVNGQKRYRIVTGSFSVKENAENHSYMLNQLGYETFIDEYIK